MQSFSASLRKLSPVHCQNNDNIVTLNEGSPSLPLHHTEPQGSFDIQERGQEVTYTNHLLATEVIPPRLSKITAQFTYYFYKMNSYYFLVVVLTSSSPSLSLCNLYFKTSTFKKHHASVLIGQHFHFTYSYWGNSYLQSQPSYLLSYSLSSSDVPSRNHASKHIITVVSICDVQINLQK